MFNETQLYDEAGRALQEGVQREHEEEAELNLQGDEELEATFTPTTPEQIVSRFFKQLVRLWEARIAERPETESKSMEGRKETAAYVQCRRHMKPFFKQLKNRTMNIEVLTTMIEITQHSQTRDYVKAHDAYIRCAIGNAPWPMGISGTGIHERQGRQHIRESKLAHIMNDETQRKYLQSVKRLLTFAQRALPANPSKMVS
uniref:Pre-mRNA-splicing factor 18 n=1 Tax=Calcidiscus leptoporus TaxID=127549 RepID=A0A7S0J483_9EUKA|mmetsp:Transcript_38557/g.90166  ORF Transcript_38557/g.90166 Transcript_38557/m.90166 type:complete len:201 (+) Transcript_38557:599-1201(+)